MEENQFTIRVKYITEPVFVNVYGAQESIPPAWVSIPGLLKRSKNTGSAWTMQLMNVKLYAIESCI